MRWPRLTLFVALLSSPLLLTVAPQGAVAKGPRAYVVQPGDTLWELAQQNGCSVDALRKQNGLDSDDPLVVGREIDLSPCSGAPADASGKTYTVVAGDSLATIARKHGTSIDELRKLNEIEGSLIRVGQQLKVPGEIARSVRLQPGQSRGRPEHGWLHAPTQLPRSALYYRRRTERTFAAAHVVD
ncbi:MAG: LysM peptidoglycan-binding domain-containing protein, partial [Myxococcales bacterium]|nr:LysM peptidoglycan-binding domain-containing protein [Myxococcales bacterium]